MCKLIRCSFFTSSSSVFRSIRKLGGKGAKGIFWSQSQLLPADYGHAAVVRTVSNIRTGAHEQLEEGFEGSWRSPPDFPRPSHTLNSSSHAQDSSRALGFLIGTLSWTQWSTGLTDHSLLARCSAELRTTLAWLGLLCFALQYEPLTDWSALCSALRLSLNSRRGADPVLQTVVPRPLDLWGNGRLCHCLWQRASSSCKFFYSVSRWRCCCCCCCCCTHMKFNCLVEIGPPQDTGQHLRAHEAISSLTHLDALFYVSGRQMLYYWRFHGNNPSTQMESKEHLQYTKYGEQRKKPWRWQERQLWRIDFGKLL